MSKNTRNRILLTALAALLLVVVAVGGTMAWLTAETDAVTNEFTPTSIDVDLTETEGTIVDGDHQFQMIPGSTIDKDPTVSVTNDDVNVWLYVTVEESSNLDTYITWEIAEGWTMLEEGVYYRAVSENADPKTFSILKNDQVTVNTSVDSDDMAALYDAQGNVITTGLPSLVFDAFVIQSDNLTDTDGDQTTADEGWAILNP